MTLPPRMPSHPAGHAGQPPQRPTPHEAELTAGTRITPGRRYGFFTDTTVCIGCKACEVACKEWNMLPSEDDGLTGMSYDNTRDLSATPGAMSPSTKRSAATAPAALPTCRRSRATG